jgi:hypothetical protein
MLRLPILSLLCLACVGARAEAPIRVLLVGSYHMDNPGLDRINVEAADVLAPERQAQLEDVVDGLARFEPTAVAVEMPAGTATAAWARWLAGEFQDARSESFQLGFRLARRADVAKVFGVDVPGPFPMDAVMAYAAEKERIGEIQREMGRVMAESQAISALSATDIAAALRRVNDRRSLENGHSLYTGLIQFGDGDRQPGVDLMAAWTTRNLGMCARLVQALEAGDRAVLVVGSSHVEPIRECLQALPGVEPVDAIDYL